MKSNNEQILQIGVERGQLVIRIGVNALAHGVANGNDFHRYDEDEGKYIRDFAIVDQMEFAKEVASQIERESENGSSPISRFLDEMAQSAIDDGCTGIDYKVRVEFEKRAKSETW